MNIRTISVKNEVWAIFIRSEEFPKGVHFYTPDEYLLQVGKHHYDNGKKIDAHYHLPVEVSQKSSLGEVLYIESGKVRVNFYSDEKEMVDSVTLAKGDLILLKAGGHGFEFLEETRMIEIKQGPFNPESKKKLTIKEKK